MRVTALNLARNIANQLAATSNDLIKLQSQIATGRRILSLSDDPVGSVKTMQLVSNLGEFDIYKSNLTYSKSYVQTTLTSLDQLLNTLSRAQEIAVQHRGSTTSQQIRQSEGGAGGGDCRRAGRLGRDSTGAQTLRARGRPDRR